ncbi:MAG: hypothetical protein SH847_04745 [Roseiflexaceae bacterium]|nr:hypothetical protein [Roseiflexaceae bacterium]
MPFYSFKAIIRKERFFIAECPELGIEARGRSVDEALACLRVETIDYILSLGDIAVRAIASPAGGSTMRRGGVIIRRYSIDTDSLTEEQP